MFVVTIDLSDGVIQLLWEFWRSRVIWWGKACQGGQQWYGMGCGLE